MGQLTSPETFVNPPSSIPAEILTNTGNTSRGVQLLRRRRSRSPSLRPYLAQPPKHPPTNAAPPLIPTEPKQATHPPSLPIRHNPSSQPESRILPLQYPTAPRLRLAIGRMDRGIHGTHLQNTRKAPRRTRRRRRRAQPPRPSLRLVRYYL